MLVMMGGPVASGKSHIAAMLKGLGATVVSRDAIRFSLLKEDEQYFAHERKVEKEFYGTISRLLEDEDAFVVADATHINPASRAKFFRKVKSWEKHKRVAIWVENCPKKAKEINTKRTGFAKVPESVIESQYNARHSPLPSEGFDNVIFVSPMFYDKGVRMFNSMKNDDIRELNLTNLAEALKA